VVSSFSIVVLAVIFQNSHPNAALVLIAVISAVLAATRRVPVNLILIFAAVIGALFIS
jgi:hypothetical protein